MEGVIEEVVQEHLDVIRVKAIYISASCPFHSEKTPGAFFVHKTEGFWGCFSCGVRGGDILGLLKGLGVKNRRVTAIVTHAKEEAKRTETTRRIKQEKERRRGFLAASILPDQLLGVYDFDAMDLINEGFEEEVLANHDVGFDTKNERITFPIRDIEGNLAGLSGRATKRRQKPKYKMYQGRHRNADGIMVPGELGEWFPKYTSEGIRDHLWRGDRVYPKIWNREDEGVIIVEGFKAALWLVQLGYPNVMAIMGSRMSAQQERLIFRMGTPTWVFLDSNSAGRRGSKDICWRLGRASFPAYECTYSCVETENDSDPHEGADLQPDDCNEAEIEEILSSAERKTRRLKRKRQHEHGSTAAKQAASKRAVRRKS